MQNSCSGILISAFYSLLPIPYRLPALSELEGQLQKDAARC